MDVGAIHKLYDAVVARCDEERPDRVLRVRALRLLVRALAEGELQAGLLAALDVQEAAIGADAPHPMTILDDAVASRAREIFLCEIAPAAEEPPLPDTPLLIVQFLRALIRDWRLLEARARAPHPNEELERRAREVAELGLARRTSGVPDFPQTPQLVSWFVRELIRDWRALRALPPPPPRRCRS
jgi:hypothetical protein